MRNLYIENESVYSINGIGLLVILGFTRFVSKCEAVLIARLIVVSSVIAISTPLTMLKVLAISVL